MKPIRVPEIQHVNPQWAYRVPHDNGFYDRIEVVDLLPQHWRMQTANDDITLDITIFTGTCSCGQTFEDWHWSENQHPLRKHLWRK